MESTVVVKEKEIRRNTAACEACQERKRKCDGKAPCSFCVGKKIECKFSQQKKRGPSKKRRMIEAEAEPMNAIVTLASVREAELLDKAEAVNYLTTYFRFDYNGVMNANNIETLLSAHTNSQKVQLYSALADAAQSCGDFLKGKAYINQARLLSGTIYDSIDIESVKALMMMRKYYYHTLNFVQCTHYSAVSWSIAKLVRVNMDPKIKMYTQFTASMSDFSTTNSEKLMFLRGMISSNKKKNVNTPEFRLFHQYLEFGSEFLEHFDFNIFFPSEEGVTNIFKDLNSVHLDETTRLRMLEAINAVQLEISNLSVDECTSLVLLNRVFCPMYQMLINWRSGHQAEAMANALTCVNAFDALRYLNQAVTHANLLALVVGYTHICMLGCVIQFFASHGQFKMAERVESHISAVCKTRGPDYDTIENFMIDFRKSGFILPSEAKALSRITPYTPELIEASSPPTSTSTPPTTTTSTSTPPINTSQDDVDPQLATLQRINNENSSTKYSLDIDVSKPITPQLLEQLRAFNLRTAPPPSSLSSSRYEDEGLKVNNAIVFQKVDPNMYANVYINGAQSSPSPSLNFDISAPQQHSMYDNNNNNNNNNNSNNNDNNNNSNTFINKQDNNIQQSQPTYLPNSNSNYQQPIYHAQYQPHPSHPQSIHPQSQPPPQYQPLPLSSQPPHLQQPHPSISSQPLYSNNFPPNNTYMQPSPSNYGNYYPASPALQNAINNLETNQDVISLIDQFLCSPNNTTTTTTQGPFYFGNDPVRGQGGVQGRDLEMAEDNQAKFQ